MRITKETGRELVMTGAAFAVGTGSIAFFYRRPVLLSAILVVTAGAIIAVRGSRHIAVYAAGAIVGPAAETFGIRAGAWSYAEPAFLGIPLWLPFAWGLAVVLVVWIADTIADLTSR